MQIRNIGRNVVGPYLEPLPGTTAMRKKERYSINEWIPSEESKEKKIYK